MADPAFAPRSLLAGLPPAGTAAVRIEEMPVAGLLLVMTRRSGGTGLAAAARAALGAEPPVSPAAVRGAGSTLIWSGPDQMLVLFEAAPPSTDTVSALARAASVSDQSDGRVLIEIGGVRVREMLATVSSLDYHPAAFPIGGAATTLVDRINVVIWRTVDDGEGSPAYRILAPSSFAANLWRGLSEAAATVSRV